MGDFSQIPPIKGIKVYEDSKFIQWHEWMNCFIQLNGRWRFKDDPEFGEVCWRFHEGTPTPDDFDFVNTRLLSSKFRYQSKSNVFLMCFWTNFFLLLYQNSGVSSLLELHMLCTITVTEML